MFFYKSSFETLLNDVKALKNKKILLVFPSQVRVEQVKNYLLDNNVSVEVLDNIWREDNLKKSKVYITYGIVSGGFYSSIQDLVVIAEPVSGTNVKRKVKREFSKGTDIESFEDLKIDDFKPEYMGKMDFYLEALDRDVKKPQENPSVGMILCKNADTDVVEYSLSRSLSQTMIAEYKTKLIDKSILQRKLAELYDMAEEEVKNSQQD